MSVAERLCSSCKRLREDDAPATGGLCPSCLESELPPISARSAGRWSPLALGVCSVFCDPLLIPTILAFARGIAELREVARREARGVWREEHERVRTGAIWGMVIAGARPILVVLALVTGMFSGAGSAPHPVLEHDELEEIFARLRSDDGVAHEWALAHLDELGPELSPSATDRALALAEDASLDETTRSGIAIALILSPHATSPERLARIEALYPQLDVEARGAILDELAAHGTAVSLGALARLARGDLDPDGPSLPDLVPHVEHASVFLPALIALPSSAGLRQELRAQLPALCRAGLDASLFEPHRARLLEDLRAARAELEAQSAAATSQRGRLVVAWHALRDSVAVMRCVPGDEVGAALAELVRLPDAAIAASAAVSILERGHELDRATVVRLAADPMSRAALYEALLALGREREMPAQHRTELALAEGHALALFAGYPPETRSYAGRQEPAPGRVVHVFAMTRDGGGAWHVAVGPYPLRDGGSPGVLTSGDLMVDVFGGEEMPTPEALAAALLAQEESR